MSLLEVEGLSVDYRMGGGAWRPKTFRAVSDVSFRIEERETFALVGESGSGKSTTAMSLVKLLPAATGTIRFDGKDLTKVNNRAMRRIRRDIQFVFQDPYSSLDPSMVIADSVGEPLQVHEGLKGGARNERVAQLLEAVGLSRQHLQRYPYEFSGGQRQRIAIARGLATRPKLLICDEVVSALDVSTQSNIINLLQDLQEEFGVAYLFISHNLAVVRHIANRVGVMYLGQLVEDGPVERVFSAPAHPYTEALLSAVPEPDPSRKAKGRIVLGGDLPDPHDRPSGCPFNTRCPYVMDVCRKDNPAPTPVDGGGSVRCHLQTTGPVLAGRSVKELPISAIRG